MELIGSAAVFLAALFARHFLGALDPIFLRAVYFVRAIFKLINGLSKSVLNQMVTKN